MFEESNMDNKLVKRDGGKFAKGNQEGKKFKKGEGGRPEGARNRRSIAAKEFAEDVLHLNPETGEQMTYEELTLYIARKADQSPRILNLLIDHLLGKPIERVQVEPKAFVIRERDQDEIQGEQGLGGFTLKESNSESEEQTSLPEGE